MKRLAVAAVVASLALGAMARALVIAPTPVMLRVATADRVIVGKVTVVAEKEEKAELFKGDARQLKIATVKVEETILGKKAKTVKVGFAFFPPPAPGGPGVRPFIRRGPAVGLVADQEAMLFLTRHPTKKDLFVIQAYFDVVNKTGNANFVADRAEAVRAAKLLANADKGLQSRDEKVRLETAAMLIARYRTAPPGGGKTEPVPAEQSKKILETLAEADWNASVPGRNFMLNPQSLFYRLSLTPKDGWEPRAFKEATQFQAAARKWLKEHAGKYRIQRFVRADDKKRGPEPEPE